MADSDSAYWMGWIGESHRASGRLRAVEISLVSNVRLRKGVGLGLDRSAEIVRPKLKVGISAW